MVRKTFPLIACALLLTGCGDNGPRMMRTYVTPGRNALADLAAPPPPAISVTPEAQQFSYTHNWSLVMNRGTVLPRFARARDACLHDKTLNCRLVSANATTDGSVSAALEVQLPHDKLDLFERSLLAPVKDERPGDAVVQSRSTQAQSVETEAGDTARKVAQLTAYRDRLAEIAKRPNLSVDDIIKLEAERARVQSDLDEATGQQRTLANGIAREDVSISLNERVAPSGPFTGFGSTAADTLSRNVAGALLFAIGALPWLPIAGLVIWLVSLFWRWLIKRRAVKVLVRREATPPQPAGSD